MGVELLDYAASGNKEPSAADSLAHLGDRVGDASSVGGTVVIGAFQARHTLAGRGVRDVRDVTLCSPTLSSANNTMTHGFHRRR